MIKNSSVKKYRNFGLFIGIFFPLVFGYLLPLILGHDFRTWTLFIGFTLIILSFISPYKLANFYKLWIWIGEVLGFVNSRIILVFIFFLILLPTAFFMRIFGYDPLRRNKNKENTYREIRENSKIDLEKIF